MDGASKAQRFKRLAEKRVNRAIRDIRLVDNLANTSNYEYTEQQVDKIVNALGREIRELKKRFARKGSLSESAFEL